MKSIESENYTDYKIIAMVSLIVNVITLGLMAVFRPDVFHSLFNVCFFVVNLLCCPLARLIQVRIYQENNRAITQKMFTELIVVSLGSFLLILAPLLSK